MQHPRDIQACMEGKRMFCSSLYIPNKNIPKDGYTSSKRNSCRRIVEDFRTHLFDQVKNYILNTVNKFFFIDYIPISFYRIPCVCPSFIYKPVFAKFDLFNTATKF